MPKNTTTQKPDRWFHYTIRAYLPSILREGIRVATAMLSPGVAPAVWFSRTPFWENTANKGIMRLGKCVDLDREGTARHGGGLVRIEVGPHVARYSWDDYCAMSGESRKMLAGLKRVSKGCRSDPCDWRVSFDPVPISSFLAVEELVDDKEWRPLAT
jgi:hypothetical protein